MDLLKCIDERGNWILPPDQFIVMSCADRVMSLEVGIRIIPNTNTAIITGWHNDDLIATRLRPMIESRGIKGEPVRFVKEEQFCSICDYMPTAMRVGDIPVCAICKRDIDNLQTWGNVSISGNMLLYASYSQVYELGKQVVDVPWMDRWDGEKGAGSHLPVTNISGFTWCGISSICRCQPVIISVYEENFRRCILITEICPHEDIRKYLINMWLLTCRPIR